VFSVCLCIFPTERRIRQRGRNSGDEKIVSGEQVICRLSYFDIKGHAARAAGDQRGVALESIIHGCEGGAKWWQRKFQRAELQCALIG
jgi:hypothetical protein